GGIAARVGAVGFPFGTANAVFDSVDATTQQDTFAFESGPAQDRIVARLTVLSGNLQPSFQLSSPGHGGGGGGHGIGPVFENRDLIVVANVPYNLAIDEAVGPYGSGSYRMYFQSLRNPQGAVAIGYGQTLPANLADAGQIDTWVFEGQTGDHFQI